MGAIPAPQTIYDRAEGGVMRSLIPWIAAGVLGVSTGVGGTLASQAVMDNDAPSRPCAIATEWANEAIIGGGEAHDSLTSDGWDRFLGGTDKLLDIRYKVCHP